MRKKLFLVLSAALVLLNIPGVSSQTTLSGSITDQDGTPIPYATVYIHQMQHGTTSNINGDYELKLEQGEYTLLYQSLGYSYVQRDVTIGNTPLVINIRLTVSYYQIPEVRVIATGEDPAYPIMRQAIARAPYYLNAVNHYRAEVYLKGSIVLNHIPRILRRNFERENPELKMGETLMSESHNEIEFNAPDNYVHRLIATQSSFPSEAEQISPMSYVQASFYEPVIADIAISPLAPNAFAHYRFSYEGSSMQGPYFINKIAVIPRRKSQQLFEGTIYIVEELWCIHSLDLVNENIIGNIRVKQIYTPVHDGFWMPVSHKFDINLSVMGFRADVEYGSSVKYLDITTNPALESMPVITTSIHPLMEAEREEVEKNISKREADIEQLLEKQELSRREMLRLSRLIEKEATSADTTQNRRENLEIKETTRYIIEEDATKKDDEFWSHIRPIPLSDQESVSLQKKDSLKTTVMVRREGDTVSAGIRLSAGQVNAPFLRTLMSAATGKTWRNGERGISFTFGGLVKPANLSFNSVEGVRYYTDLRFTKRWEKGYSLSIYPSIGYAFSAGIPFGSLNTNLYYRKTKNDFIYLRTGSLVRDYNNFTTINRTLNTTLSLNLKNNISRLYLSQFITTGHRAELWNGFYLEVSGTVGRRERMINNTNFSFFRRDRDYKPNIPENPLINTENQQLRLPTEQSFLHLSTDLTFIPYQRYRISGGRKVPAGSSWPTITLRHTWGGSEITGGSRSDFNRLSAGISQNRSTGPLASFNWIVRGGATITSDTISFYDFKHFNAQDYPLLLNEYQDAFYTADWYSMATDSWYLEAHAKYTTPYLLVKYLPGLSKTLMRENLYFGYLNTRELKHFTELGYSISEILLIGEAGVFVSFDNFKFNKVAFRFIIKIN